MKYSKINHDECKHWITLEVDSHRNLIRANYKKLQSNSLSSQEMG